MSNNECHLLPRLLKESSRFCPLEFIKVISKELAREIGDCNITKPIYPVLNYRNTESAITCLRICQGSERDDNSNGSETVMSEIQKVATEFIEQHHCSSILVFTDGSVFDCPVGCEACSAVLYAMSDTEKVQVHVKPVGKRVTSVRCEIEGIIQGIEIAIQSLHDCQSRRTHETIYRPILCDCNSAIEAVINKSESNKYPGVLRRLQDLCDLLNNSSASVKPIHIPGHAGIHGNEIADVRAREVARDIYAGKISASNDISVYDRYKLAALLLKKSWQRK